jgi:hypothetical protein
MRIAFVQSVKSVLVPLLAWSALGLEVDLVSGPLTAEAALRVLCELMVTSREGTGQASPHHSTAIRPHVGRPSAPGLPPGSSVVTTATWSAPMIPADSAAVRAPRIGGHAVVLESAPFSVSRFAAPQGVTAFTEVGLPCRLCRLHC